MVYRQLLRYISAGRIADDVRTIGSDQVEQSQGIGHQQRERKVIRRLRDLGIAMTSQVKSHNPITTRQRRHPLKPALGIAHCRVQEKDRIGLAPRIGKVVDVIGKLKSVSSAEGAVHFFWSLATDLSDASCRSDPSGSRCADSDKLAINRAMSLNSSASDILTVRRQAMSPLI